MTQYFNDCTSLTGLSDVGINSGTDYTDEGTYLQKTTNSLEVLKLDAVDSDANRANVEVLVKVAIDTVSTTHYIAIGRGSGDASGSYTGYIVALRATALRLYRRGSGSFTEIDSDAATHSSDTEYWVWLRCNGSTIQGYSSTSAEYPSTWTNSTTDETYNTAGYAGIQGTPSTTAHWYSGLGVGTNGDQAPSSAPATGVTAGARNLLLLATG